MESCPGRDTWPRAAQPLLFARRGAFLAGAPWPVPIACRRARESASIRRLRAVREPHIELRPVAALAQAVPPLHGEIRALLVAPQPSDQRRRRLSSPARRG